MTLKNIVLITCIIEVNSKFSSQMFLEEALYDK